MAHPYFSVIASIHQHNPYFAAMIASLNRQTDRDLELVLILDAPDRDDRAAIKADLDRLDPAIELKLRSNRTRRGLTANLNTAIALARGDVLVRLDSDDEMAPTRLQVIRPHFERGCQFVGNASAVVVAGETVSFYPEAELGRQQALARGLALQRVLAHSAFAFHRDLAARIGGYDEAYRFAQDYDLLLRSIRALGDDQFIILADRLTRITVHPSAISSASTRLEQAFLQLCRAVLFQLEEDGVKASMATVGAAIRAHPIWPKLEDSHEWRRQLRSRSRPAVLMALACSPLRAATMLRHRALSLKLIKAVSASLRGSVS